MTWWLYTCILLSHSNRVQTDNGNMTRYQDIEKHGLVRRCIDTMRELSFNVSACVPLPHGERPIADCRSSFSHVLVAPYFAPRCTHTISLNTIFSNLRVMLRFISCCSQSHTSCLRARPRFRCSCPRLSTLRLRAGWRSGYSLPCTLRSEFAWNGSSGRSPGRPARAHAGRVCHPSSSSISSITSHTRLFHVHTIFSTFLPFTKSLCKTKK